MDSVKTWATKLLTAGAIAAAGCGADAGDGTMEPPMDGIMGGDDEAPTWTMIFDGIIRPSCSCHLDTQIDSGGLDMLDRDSALANLANQPATEGGECDGNTRVIPGNAEDSVLFRKVAGVNLCGDRMPQGGPFLSQSQIDMIRDWIDAAAPND